MCFVESFLLAAAAGWNGVFLMISLTFLVPFHAVPFHAEHPRKHLLQQQKQSQTGALAQQVDAKQPLLGLQAADSTLDAHTTASNQLQHLSSRYDSGSSNASDDGIRSLSSADSLQSLQSQTLHAAVSVRPPAGYGTLNTTPDKPSSGVLISDVTAVSLSASRFRVFPELRCVAVGRVQTNELLAALVCLPLRDWR